MRETDIRGSGLSAAPVAIVASGIAVLVCAFSSAGTFRDPTGEVNGRFALPLSAGIALILSGLLLRTRWKTTSLWFGLFLISQAASLQMIDAGKLIHFQHYRTLPDLLANELTSVTIVGLQIIAVSIGISSHFSAIVKWVRIRYAVWKLVAIGIFLFFAGAAVTPSIPEYSTSLVLASVVRAVSCANIILLLWSVPDDLLAWLKPKFRSVFDDRASDLKASVLDRFIIFAMLWVVLVSGGLSYFVYQAHPHVPDEAQYVFQAKYMAAGQLTEKPPAVPEAFSMYMVPFNEERWFGIFSPAWPAVLAIGMKAGVPWLVNPILSGLCVLLAYALFCDLYSRRAARIAIFLLCSSPWFIFMGMSLMSHTLTLFCSLAAVLLLREALRSGKAMYALASGVFVGILSLVRPYDGVLVAVLLGIWTIASTRTLGSRFLKPAIALAIGTIAIGALVFPYNQAVTGQAAISPPDAYYTKYFWPGANSIGFGPDRGFHWALDAFPGHSPIEAIVNAALNTSLLDTELFGWGIGSLILISFFLLSGKYERRDVWALAIIGTIIGGYSLFWYHGGPDFGARYWFLCIIPLIALTVRSIEWLGWEIESGSSLSLAISPRVMLGVSVLCLGTVVCYLPWRALDKYYHYLRMQPGITELARVNSFGKSLVLVRGDEHPDYQSAWVYNPVNFEGDVPLYAFDKNEDVERSLLNAYSERPVWIVDGPTRTDGNYRIVAGPLSSQELLMEGNRYRTRN